MKLRLRLLGMILVTTTPLSPFAIAQETAPSERQPIATPQVPTLTLSEQLTLRAAERKAAEDPEVQAALAKRNAAIEEFRKAMHDSMVKADPKMKAILDKIAVGGSPGF